MSDPYLIHDHTNTIADLKRRIEALEVLVATRELSAEASTLRPHRSLEDVFRQVEAEIANWPLWKRELLARARQVDAYFRNKEG